MKSIKSVYKIGNGPSSSHTVGPYRAAKYFKKRYPGADEIRVTLFGSLAHTGEGHSTSKAILTMLPDAKISVDKEKKDLPHPNTMHFEAYRDGKMIGENTILSIGGGSIRFAGEEAFEEHEIYPEKNFTQMLETCEKSKLSLKDFVWSREGESVREYIRDIWHAMEKTIERGLETEGILPGGLNITRKAKSLYNKVYYNESADITMNRKIAAYAYAAAEENACENVVVTAPTCGSCGVIPAVFYYLEHDKGFPEEEIIDALAVAGLVGNVIRTNASISGAECGCQAEIGSACSMAAAGIASLYKLPNDQIEYSAETAMEHNLGLTCDPVNGLVQIPCIERNSVAAMRAIEAVNLARVLSSTRKISFDTVVETMYQTGKDMNEKYRETAHGGLAALYKKNS